MLIVHFVLHIVEWVSMVTLTPDGYARFTAELQKLQNKRPEEVTELSRARDLGDRSENAAYKVARSKVSSIDRRIRYLTHLLEHARIIRPTDNSSVTLGKKVTVRQGERQTTYRLVDSVQSDVAQGDISIHSPVGRALLHKKVGDRVIIVTPAGEKIVHILEIQS